MTITVEPKEAYFIIIAAALCLISLMFASVQISKIMTSPEIKRLEISEKLMVIPKSKRR